MSAVAKTAEGPQTIASIVREAWGANPGDMPGAAAALFTSITTSPALLNDVMPSILRSWCREQVGEYVGRLRAAALAPVENPGEGGRLRLAITRTLFDFPLPGGKRLGDANAKEIEAGASAYRESADDAAHKARWLLRVAEKVGRKNRAENALTAQQLEELYEEARDAD